MRKIISSLLKSAAVAAVVAGSVTAVSCLRDDDLEILRHPIHIQGNISPTLAIPIGTGEMTLNDLLSNLSSEYRGYIDETADVLTVIYDTSFSDVIYPLSSISTKPVPTPRPARKDGTTIPIDTVFSQSVDIDFFDNADLQSIVDADITIKGLQLTLEVAAWGQFYPERFKQYVTATCGDIKISYVDHDGVPHEFQGISTEDIDIPDLTDSTHIHFDHILLDDIVNSLPKKIDISYRLRLNVSTDIISDNIGRMSFREVLDSIRMTKLNYSAHVKLDFPVSFRIGGLEYVYDLDLGDGLSSVDLEETVREFSDSVSVNIDTLLLRMDMYNRLPFAFSVDGTLLDENEATLLNVLEGQKVRGASLSAHQPAAMAFDTSHTELLIGLNDSDIDRIHQAKTLRLRLRVDTQDRHVVVRREDYLRIRACLLATASAHFNVPVLENGIL